MATKEFLKWESFYRSSLQEMYSIFHQRMSALSQDNTYPYEDFALFIYKNTLTTLDKRTQSLIRPQI